MQEGSRRDRTVALSLVPDGGEEVAQLDLDDLPLGPWAGAELHVWASKAGTRWHANESCADLRSKARTEIYQQPAQGSLADRQVPTGLHCQPTGPLGEYLRAAKLVVRYAHATDTAGKQLDAGDIPLQVLPYADRWAFDRSDIEALKAGPLSDIWEAERERRKQVVEQSRRELNPTGDPIALIAIARWVRAGRTPRQHQERYTRFINAGADELERLDLTASSGHEWHINNDLLPNWLDAIASGRSITNVSRALIEAETERYQRWPAQTPEIIDKIREAWTAASKRWQQMIESMTYAHPGAVLALFHYYRGTIDPDFIDACIDAGPAALLQVGDLDWVVAMVPAALRLQLAERDRGLTGLVLLEEGLYQIKNEMCARFLRNLVTWLGHPELAKHVTVTHSDDNVDEDVTDESPDVGSLWPKDGFASVGRGNGVTLADCAPALRAALADHDLPTMKKPSAPQRRSPRRRR